MMKRVRSRRDVTGLTSTLTRGKLTHMPETRPDLFEKTRSHDRRELIDMARENDLLPYFREVESEPGPIVTMEGRERLMMGSNNYLGLTGDARVKEAARQALERYGTALTGSRLMNGTLPMHRELEAMIAEWMQTDDALVFTTGYQANVGALSSVLSASDTVIADSGDHASILDGCKLSGARLRPFRHGASTSSRPCWNGRPATAAAPWWWSTASTPWRAMSATWRPWRRSAGATAPG